VSALLDADWPSLKARLEAVAAALQPVAAAVRSGSPADPARLAAEAEALQAAWEPVEAALAERRRLLARAPGLRPAPEAVGAALLHGNTPALAPMLERLEAGVTELAVQASALGPAELMELLDRQRALLAEARQAAAGGDAPALRAAWAALEEDL